MSNEQEFNERLMHQIQRYWALQGYSIDIHVVEATPTSMTKTIIWGVRSNMVNGYPVDALR